MKTSSMALKPAGLWGWQGWLAISAIFLLAGIDVEARPLPETIRKVKPSIVGVGTFQATRRPPARLAATGFVVGDGRHVVTNAHVIPKNMNLQKKEFLAVFAGRGSRAKRIPAREVAIDHEHDLALLKTDGPKLPVLAFGDSEDVEEGQSIAFTGFPVGSVLGLYPVTHGGIVSAVTPIVIPVPSARQLDAKLIGRMRSPYTVFQLDATAYPGNSGSPMYDPSTGEVLGVINKVFIKESKETILERPSGITYAIPARYARTLLRKGGLPAGTR